jgi:hypothetical protein
VIGRRRRRRRRKRRRRRRRRRRKSKRVDSWLTIYKSGTLRTVLPGIVSSRRENV